MSQSETETPGVFDTLGRLASTVPAILQNRLELLVVELQEERIRHFNALLLAATIVALGFFTLATVAVALLIVAWNEYGVRRLLAASGLGLVSMLKKC
ncbi:MAG: phage holin family protein [Verrucomicrobiales bacterium]|nr:phage holin family protein [Verrucomicrobiales bacterium]